MTQTEGRGWTCRSREEVKALPLQTIFEDATRGEDTAFGHSDQDTFEFAIRRARTATQRLVDSTGQRFSGRVRVLTDPTTLTVTYSRAGTEHAAAPAARARIERKVATAKTGAVIETRNLLGGSKVLGRDRFSLEDETAQVGEGIYSCQPGCKLSIGPAAAKGDDIRCSYCGKTNAEYTADSVGSIPDDAEDARRPTLPTIRLAYHVVETGIAEAVRVSTGKRKTRKEVRDGDLGDAITVAANKARKETRRKARHSLARRKGR